MKGKFDTIIQKAMKYVKSGQGCDSLEVVMSLKDRYEDKQALLADESDSD